MHEKRVIIVEGARLHATLIFSTLGMDFRGSNPIIAQNPGKI